VVPPANPRMVTEYLPAGATENVLKVSVLAPVAGFGLKDVKTPGGGFNTNKKTVLLNPPSGVILMVLAAAEPCRTVRSLCEAESRKSGCDGGGAGAFTVRLIVVVLVKLPDVPVMVILPVPNVALLPAVNVRVLELSAGFWLNEAVTPLGKPEGDSETLLLKPFTGVIVIVLLPLEPCVIVRVLGDADREKSGWFGAAEPGQFFTKFAALMVPSPVAKSQPTAVPKAGWKELSEVESTPTKPEGI
jgi:hypothetical protein